MIYHITEASSEKKLLDYLRKTLGLSRAEITALKKKENGILLNGSHVTVRAVLHTGDTLSLDQKDRTEDENENILPRELPLSVLYEDEELIAVNKPFGMPTHPSHGHFDDTLANAIAFYFKEKGIPFVFRAVNRLDRDTSGIVLIAKTRAAAYQLSRQLTEGSVIKRYLAVTDGILDKSGCVIANIKRAQESIITRVVCPEKEGQYAETRYTPIAWGENRTVLEVSPKTGRTHQIRVHLSHIGHPICGDTLYGRPEGSDQIARQALHCFSLTFRLPSSGREITVSAPLHPDMQTLVDRINEAAALKKGLCYTDEEN